MGRGVKLDFIVIGFPKCGTKSVREWAREHPQIAMAPGSAPRLPWELEEEHFADQPADGLKGVVCPTFCGTNDLPGRVERLTEHNPDIKVIALLRDVIDRAYSQWRMESAYRDETRTFAEAIRQQLDRKPDWSRQEDRRMGSYLAYGHYDAMLSPFAQIDVLAASVIHEADVARHRIADFLGVEPGPPMGRVGENRQLPYEPVGPELQDKIVSFYAGVGVG